MGLQIPSFTYPEVSTGDLLDAELDGLVCNMPDAHDLEAVAFAGSVLKKVFQ